MDFLWKAPHSFPVLRSLRQHPSTVRKAVVNREITNRSNKNKKGSASETMQAPIAETGKQRLVLLDLSWACVPWETQFPSCPMHVCASLGSGPLRLILRLQMNSCW